MCAWQFSRTVAPTTSRTPALIALVRSYQWTRAVVLSDTVAFNLELALEITERMTAAGLKIFYPRPYDKSRFNTDTFTEIQRTGYRIVILVDQSNWGPYENVIATKAQIAGLTRRWAWIQADAIQPADAPVDRQGWLYLRTKLPSEGMETFAELVSEYTKSSFNINVSVHDVDLEYSAALHDAIMVRMRARVRQPTIAYGSCFLVCSSMLMRQQQYCSTVEIWVMAALCRKFCGAQESTE